MPAGRKSTDFQAEATKAFIRANWEHMSNAQIAAQLGVSTATVSYHAGRMGLPAKRKDNSPRSYPSGHLPARIKAKAWELWRENDQLDIATIAQALDVDEDRLRNHLYHKQKTLKPSPKKRGAKARGWQPALALPLKGTQTASELLTETVEDWGSLMTGRMLSNIETAIRLAKKTEEIVATQSWREVPRG